MRLAPGRVIGNVAKQQREAVRKQQRRADVRLARFGSRISRATPPSASRGRHLSAWRGNKAPLGARKTLQQSVPAIQPADRYPERRLRRTRDAAASTRRCGSVE